MRSRATVQKHARLFAVLETLDNGKPIRETRDIDIPLVARHFYHHAGWAQLLETRVPGSRAGRRRRADHPVEFPAADAGVEDRAGARGRQHGGAQAGGVHAAHRACCSPRSARGRPARRAWSTSSPATATTGAALVEHPGVDKIAFTGSTEVGRGIRKATAGTGKKLSLELGGKSPFIVFDDADLDSAVEGVVDAIWFNQGQVCCAGSRLLVQESIADDASSPSCARAWRRCASAIRSTRRSTSARSSRRCSSSASDALVQQGVDEGRELCRSRRWSLPAKAASIRRRCSPTSRRRPRIAQVEIFGPVLVAMTFRTPAEAVALANNTRYGLAASVWTENINLALDVAPQHQGRRGLGQLHQLFDAAVRLRRLPRKRLRPRRRARGDVRVSEAVERTNGKPYPKAPALNASPGIDALGRCGPIDRTAKMYIGGKQARPDGGYSCAVLDRRGSRGRRCRRRQPQGHPQRRRSGGEGGRPGARRRRTIARRFSITSPRISAARAAEFAAASQRHDRRLGPRRQG